jgi:Calcineurin-like phosphoesterase
MRLRSFMPTLLLASLLYAGCTQSAPSPPAQTKGAPPSSAQTESVRSSPAQTQGGLPLLTPMTGTGQLAPSNAKQFTFAVFGDNQGDQKSSEIISRIFEAVRDYQHQKPVFAFSLGDIVRGKDADDSEEYIQRKYADYLDLAKKAGVPVFNAPGNHEMDDKDDIPSERMHQLYRDSVAPTYGAFNYGNSRFIALNTEDVPPAGTPPPPNGIEFSYIGDTQLQQLDQDLAANKDKTHIFIMMHYPIEPQRQQDNLNPDSLKKLTDILAKYKNISYVLASHEHLYYNPQDPGNIKTVAPFKVGDPTRYLVSGGAGATIYVQPANGGFHHYLIIEVDGDNVFVKINRMDS